MELSHSNLESNLLNQAHQESYSQHQRLVRTYEDILESEVNRANPVLKGHTNEVVGVALTSDNSFLISASKDNTIRIWSLIDRKEEQKISVTVPSGEEITSLTLSHDNKHVVLRVLDKHLIVFNLATKKGVASVRDHKEPFESISFSDSNVHFLTTSNDSSESVYFVKIWNLAGKEVQSHKLHDLQVYFAYMRNNVVYSGDTSGRLIFWDFSKGSEIQRIETGISFLCSGRLSTDGRWLAIGAFDGSVHFWDLLEKAEDFKLELGLGYPLSFEILITSEKKIISYVTDTRRVVFVDAVSKSVIRSFIRHNDSIKCFCQTNDGKLVITGSTDKTIKIWQQGEFRDYKASNKYGSNIRATSLDRSSDSLAVVYNNTTLKVFNLSEDRETLNLSWKGESVYAAIWTHDKTQFISSDSTPEIKVFNVETKNIDFVLKGHSSTINKLLLTPDSKWLYGANGNQEVYVWNFETKTLDHQLVTESCVYSLAILADGSKLITGGDSVILVWDLNTRSVISKLEGNTSSVRCLALLSNQKTLISGGNDGNVKIWDLEEGKEIANFEEGSAWARDLALYNNEKFVVVVHDTSLVTIIDVEEKKIEHSFNAPNSQYCCRVIDDKTLVMADSELIRYYDLVEKKDGDSFKVHSDCIPGLLINKETDTIITASHDRKIKSWSIAEKTVKETYQSTCGTIRSISLKYDNIMLGTDDGSTLIYSISEKREIKSLSNHSGAIRGLDIQNSWFASGGDDKKVVVFNSSDYTPIVFQGEHGDWVRCVKLSPDTSFVYSGSDDKSICVWNIEKKSLDFKLTGHEGYVHTLAVFPNSKFIASGSADKVIKIWDLSLRLNSASIECHTADVKSLLVSDDEQILFSGGADNQIFATDLETKKTICTFNGHNTSVIRLDLYNNTLYSLGEDDEIKTWLINEKKEIFCFRWRSDYGFCSAISQDGSYFAAGFNEGAVRVYDFKQSKFLDTFMPVGNKQINKVSFTEDSKHLLIASSDQPVIIWDIDKKEAKEVQGSKNLARCLGFSRDYKLLATASNESKVVLWDWPEQKILHSFEGHTSDVNVLVFSPDNKFLFSGSDDNLVFKWDLETKENFAFKDHSGSVKGIGLAYGKRLLVTGGHDKKVNFYDLDKNELIKSEEKHTDWVRTLAVSHDEKYAVSAGDDKVLRIWDLSDHSEKWTIEGHSNYIYSVAFSVDGRHLYSVSSDKSIVSWNFEERTRESCLRTTCGSIYSIVINKAGTLAYTGSDESTINVFDLVSKTEIACMMGHTKTVCDLALSEDEKLLVSGSHDYQVRVFDLDTYKEIALFKDVHTDYVRSVAITRDNKYVISGSDDRFIVFWNLKTKQKEFIFEGHRNYVHSIRLTYDEKYLISASRDETIRTWRISDKAEEFSFTGHTGPVKCLAVYKNNKNFASGGEDNLIKIWSILDKREDFTLKGHTASINCIKITSDDYRLISGSDDKMINVWDLQLRTLELKLASSTVNILAVNITEEGNLLLSAGSERSLKLWKMSEPRSSYAETMSHKPVVHVSTPDDKFELHYLYGRLNEITKKDSEGGKLELGITDTYDPYYQNLIKFYNIIDNLRSDVFETLRNDVADIVFSKFSYTFLHVLANVGNYKLLEKLLGENTVIKTDYFGKSPMFYAIAKQYQGCVDILLDFLISLSESKDKTKIQTSFSSISSDISLIIKNSSKRLHLLLRSCLIPTDPTFAKVRGELPIFQYNSNFLPIATDFVTGDTKSLEVIPVIMKYTPFQLPAQVGSHESIELLEAIIECSNTSIYSTHLVQYLIQIQWDRLIYWVFGYTLLLWMNLVLLVYIATHDNILTMWTFYIFVLVNILLLVWESIQLFMAGFLEYFSDPWNIIDSLRFILTVTWVVLNVTDFHKSQPISDGKVDTELEYRIIAWLMALFNFARGLTGFRLIDGTRYYVRLILRALGDMGYFLIMLSYSTICFGVMFQVSRTSEPFSFKTLWMDSYSLNFGNFEAQDQYEFSFETCAYMLATVINVILMLNLLISILGDSFSNFQTEKVFIDFSEKAGVILEIQKMFFWVGNLNNNQYFHVLCSSAAAEEEETIDEKVSAIEEDINFLREEIVTNNASMKTDLGNQIKMLDNKIDDKNSLVQSKIAELETKIGAIGENINKILEFVKPKEEVKVEEAKTD